MFENVRKIKFSGAAFTDETTLPLYIKSNERMSLIYGRNGSGKSTIAKAFGKIKGIPEDSIISAALLDEHDKDISLSEDDAKHIYVFDEDYIQRNVRLKEDGLSTIVILGQQGELEDKITEAQGKYDESEQKRTQQDKICSKYIGISSPLSPDYFLNKMSLALFGDGHWAGREREINASRQNAAVKNNTYLGIVEKVPPLSEAEVISKYTNKFTLLQQARRGDAKITERIPETINNLIDEHHLKELLKKKLERPELSDREEYLLTLIECGRLDEIRSKFSSEETVRCPFCYQPITSEYRHGLNESIKKVLSNDVEEHQAELLTLRMEPVEVNMSPFGKLNKAILSAVDNALKVLNEAISKCNIAIQKKYDDPFTPITDFTVTLSDKIQTLNEAISKLADAREEYNKPFDDIKSLQRELKLLNKQRAYYEILPFYESYTRQLEEKNSEDTKLQQLTADMNKKEEILLDLKDQKRSVNIAVDLINYNLRYVFFAEKRLAIKSQNGVYSLLSRDHEVKPSDISVGERNIIALCYFFVDMLTNLSLQDRYCNDMMVVIDDPVSSFDFENKVGIMSFLRSKIEQLMSDNLNTKLLVLTHDLSAVFDIEKSFGEVSNVVKTHAGASCIYHLFELENKNLKDFSFKKRHEYSELMKITFNYAKSKTPEYELTIGNIMRRVLEAFSTFVYKKGIDTISCDDSILKQLVESEYQSYFGNLMYRLVLNGESHMEERTKALIDPEFTATVSSAEKQRTAQDIICFMYLLNPIHVKAHLNELGNVEPDIKRWCSRIKQFAQVEN